MPIRSKGGMGGERAGERKRMVGRRFGIFAKYRNLVVCVCVCVCSWGEGLRLGLRPGELL